MRTSRFAILGAVVALAGCDGGLEALGGVTRKAPDRIALPDGTIVAGAKGWCVDTATSRAQGDTAVVVLGSCAAIAGNALAPRPDVPGLVTVSVEAEAGYVPNSQELESFFVTEAGRAILARDGRAESVDILETQRDENLLYLHAYDKSVPSGSAADIWRALFDLEGRFVSVSLYGKQGVPIERDEGLETLARQVDELRLVNGR